MAYIHFTEQEKEKAKQTCIADIVRRNGGTVRQVGSGEEWLDNGQKVSINGNLWYHQYNQEGGNAVDFVIKFMDKSYPDAMEYLLGKGAGELKQSPPIEKKIVNNGKLVLPERNRTMRRVYAYLLSKRKIDKDIVDFFVKQGMIYESTKYHNVVFVGFDKNNNPMHASFRSTIPDIKFRGNAPNCTPEFSFHYHGKNEKLYLFESPIDMMSYICLNKDKWKENSYASCCGVGERVVYQMMKDNENIKKVIICLDSDFEGQKAVKRIQEKLNSKCIEKEVIVPNQKDFNDDLIFLKENQQEEIEESKQCQALQF